MQSVVIFHSGNHVIWAAKLLGKAGVSCRMIPIPRHLSSDCGYCIRIRGNDSGRVQEILREGGVEFDRVEAINS